MLKLKLVASLFFLIIFSSFSFCIAEEGPGGATGASSSSSVKILKVVGIVKMINASTLYLENNQKYNLSNVKVKYDKGKPKPNKKRKAEMYFVNDVLKEVTIYY